MTRVKGPEFDFEKVEAAQPAPEKRLFLLDAMALIYRAHFALIRSPRFTTSGRCTSAVFGVANTLFDLLTREKPTHIAVVFDAGGPTERHEAFPEYKAQREAAPEDLALQFPLVDRLFEALRMPTVRIPGFEADDIIGTLACQAQQEGFITWMVTPDKDFHQLVNDKILVYKPGRLGAPAELLGVTEVLKRWQVERVEQVIDILGLMGDSIDNIPGIPGVGEKTAQKLIAQFGSVENLLAKTNQLNGKQKELIEAHAEQALLSKRLATIVRDAPHKVRFDTLKMQPYDEGALKALFIELEFDALGKRVLGQSFTAFPSDAAAAVEQREIAIQARLFEEPVEPRSINDVAHQYQIVRSPAERSRLIETLRSQTAIGMTIAPSSLDARTALPLGIAFSFAPHSAYYVVCPNDEKGALAILEEFRPVFESESIEKIGRELKFQATLLRWRGIELRGTLLDIGLAHAMKEPELRQSPGYLAKLYLGYTPIAIGDIIGQTEGQQISLREAPLERVAEFASEDADVALRVSKVIRPDIEAQGVAQVCYDVECPLIPALVEMEYNGIRLDAEALKTYGQQLSREIEQLRRDIYQSAGREFNIESPKQLGVVLYDELKLAEKPKKTATGQFTTRETELLRLAGEHRIVRDVLDYRNAVKLKSVYVDQLPSYVNPSTGRLHTHYSQTWIVTGRMQSNDPNLQTIPIRKERGREIRAAFVPRSDEYLLLSADYSQIELRIMAELSGDPTLMEAFASGTDIHTVTAANVFKVPRESVTREMRDKAKAVNFGIIYGISAFGLQQRLNIPRDEARALIENYYERHPRVRAYIEETIAFGRAEGYVKTCTGRRRYLRDINSRNQSIRSAAERLAMNSPIQGTAADMLKLAMIKVHHLLRSSNFKTKMLLTVHDEIVFDLHRSEQETVMPLIEECMKTALPMTVPLVIEMGVGKNWLEAH